MSKTTSKAYDDLHAHIVQLIDEAFHAGYIKRYTPPPPSKHDDRSHRDGDKTIDRRAHILLLQALQSERQDAFQNASNAELLWPEMVDTTELLSKIWQAVSHSKHANPDLVGFGAALSSDERLWANIHDTYSEYAGAKFMFFRLAKEPKNILILALRDRRDRSLALHYILDYINTFREQGIIELLDEIIQAVISEEYYQTEGRSIIRHVGRLYPKQLHAALKRSMDSMLAETDIVVMPVSCAAWLNLVEMQGIFRKVIIQTIAGFAFLAVGCVA